MRRSSADELRKLKDKAAEAAGKGKLEKAADLYREVLEAEPRDIVARQKLAEVLRRAGRIPDAIQAYSEVADRFGQDGLLIKAIAISKTILELDPEHVETQSALADLYARKAEAERARPPARTMMMQAIAGAAREPPQEPAPAKPAAPPSPPEDDVVAIPLGPPAASPNAKGGEVVPLEIAVDAEAECVPELARPPPLPSAPPPLPPAARAASAAPRGAPQPATELARIVLAAEEAVEAGIADDVLVEADPIDVEVSEIEPLEREAGTPVAAFTVPRQEPDASAIAGDPEPLEIEVESPEAAPAPEVPPGAPSMIEASSTPPAPPASRPPSAVVPLAAGGPGRAEPPAAQGRGLPRVPIFSDLSRDAFVELTQGMVLHRIPQGDAVIREGEDGTSFYVVASGRFTVTKRDDAAGMVVLSRLGEGDFFGEMALLSGARRSASVTADEESEVLEFRADVLRQIAARHPHLAQSLRRFYRQRLLATVMAVSPIFRPFPRGDRKLLMERFRSRSVSEGEVIIREGETSDGLYVVLEGAVDVIKRKDGQDAVVGELREGDLFGEMSCLRKAPASAGIVVKRAGTLLRLPRKDFDELVVTHPQILELVSTLSEERAENLDAILTGHAQWTDEGLVLT